MLRAPLSRDMRVIATSTRHVPDIVDQLMIWQIRVPPLRARRVDILMWFQRFAGVELDADLVEAIVLAPWRDNLRGLERLANKVSSAGGTDLAGLQTLLGECSSPSVVASRRAIPTTDELSASAGEAGPSSTNLVRTTLARTSAQVQSCCPSKSSASGLIR